MTDETQPAPGFETDIRPLFRERDRTAMLRAFDLWSYADVRAHAQPISDQLKAGTMPCDGQWPADDVTRFADWISGGTLP
jgi:hypothetical protein